MKREAHFKTGNRGFPINITGFIVHGDVLLVVSFIQIVRWFWGVLGMAFEVHEMTPLKSYTENNG